jgi:hypothetical protein
MSCSAVLLGLSQPPRVLKHGAVYDCVFYGRTALVGVPTGRVDKERLNEDGRCRIDECYSELSAEGTASKKQSSRFIQHVTGAVVCARGAKIDHQGSRSERARVLCPGSRQRP